MSAKNAILGLSVLLALLCTTVLIFENLFRNKLENKIILLEANLHTQLSAGEARQTLTYLHADFLKAGHKLTSAEKLALQKLILTLTSQQIFLEEAKAGPFTRVSAQHRQMIQLLPNPSAVFISPEQYRLDHLKKKLENEINHAFIEGHDDHAARDSLKYLRGYKSEKPEPTSPDFYDPALAAEQNAQVLALEASQLRTSLDRFKLIP
jgi:hypothetical protein